MSTKNNKKGELLTKINEKINVRKEIERKTAEAQQRKFERQIEMIKEIKEYFSELPPYTYEIYKIDNCSYIMINVKTNLDTEIFVRRIDQANGKYLMNMNELQDYDTVATLYDNREKILEKILEELK